MSRRRAAVVVAGVFLLSGCGGSSGPSPAGPAPTTTPTPATAPTPSPTPSAPPTASSCPLGKGVFDPPCDRNSPTFLAEVDAAIERVVGERPELFDKNNIVGPGGFFVRDPDAYHAGVVEALRGAGFCAEFDKGEVQIKNTNEFSEQYDVLLSSDHIRRGDGSYRATCTPAAFPVDPADVIDSIRVAFFDIKCPDGRPTPGNNEGLLPLGCEGIVTATPKDTSGNDVPKEVHGPDIEWSLRQNGEIVELADFPDEPFNKRLTGLQLGEFHLCAEVQTVEGCLNGEVIP